MNYSDPDGEQIDIALTRLSASGENRQGALLFNFGGFAGGGIVDLQDRAVEGLIPDAITEAYDLLSFDQRGSGESAAVDCSAQGAGDENPFPANADQINELVSNYQQIARDCMAEYGEYLQHISTINVVRDMDSIRVALGEDSLNFYGASAGTRMAALYLQEFPQSSGRFVLDASVLPNSSINDLLVTALPAMEQGLRDGLSLCSEDFPDCDAAALSSQLSARTQALAIENTEDSRLELLIVDLIIGATLESPELWPFAVGPVLNYVNTSDISHLLDLIALFIDFDEPAELFSEEDPGLIAARALLCADDATRPDNALLIAKLEELNQLSDYHAESFLALLAHCSGWPESLEPLAPIATNTAPTALFIGGTSDALSPPEWSTEMATQIGGVYVSSDHDGHTGLFDEKSGCLERIVSEFLVDGTVPDLSGPVPATDACDGS